jgi:DNA-binding NarL/FixJ family response regulator
MMKAQALDRPQEVGSERSVAADTFPKAQAPGTPIEVVVAVQPALFADVVSRALDTLPGFRVVPGGAGNGKTRPRVILVDEAEFERNGYQNARALRELAPATRLLVMGRRSNEDSVARVIRAGASGLVENQSDLMTLARAIRAVAAGAIWAGGRSASRSPLGPTRLPRRRSGPPGCLTEREWEIADGVAQGLRNKEIAVRLKISQNTVKNHLNSIFRRLNVDSRVALGMWALVRPKT